MAPVTPRLGDKHPREVLSPFSWDPMSWSTPASRAASRTGAWHWACYAPNCFPRDQRDSQGSVGHRRTCHHLPRSLGKGCSPSALSCLALLHEGQLKPSSQGRNSGILLCPYPASSQAPSPGLSRADPVLPHPTPCQGLLACAQPVQNQPQGISMALKHAKNFTQAFGFLFLPRALPHGAGFVRQVKAQLLELLTLHRGCFPAPFHENHLFSAAEPQMSV